MLDETTKVARFPLIANTLSRFAMFSRWTVPVLAAGTFLACGIDSRPPTSDLSPGVGGSSSKPSGGMGGEGDDGTGGDSATGSTSGGGTGGVPSSSVCGDSFLEPDEECEAGNFRDKTCQSFGFSEGHLTCKKSCKISTSDCSGVEDCFDGKDNDGDGLVDCHDEADCSDVCENACLAPPVFIDGMYLSGTTEGRGNLFDSTCSATPSGNEVVYQVTAGKDGRLDVILQTNENLTVSVMTACGDPTTELVCAPPKLVSVDAFEGEIFYVTVEGMNSSSEGHFALETRSRVPACGDGVREGDEECDDLNTRDGDGCDENCFVEADEDEPNGTPSNASPLAGEMTVGEIRPASDVDVYAVTLSAASSSIVANTFHLGDGACLYNLMDTVIDILDTDDNSNVVLVSDDNGGDGLCASAVASALPAGTYYIRVSAKGGAVPATFPYVLDVAVGECGDGDQTMGEECDDGNTMNGDGCNQNCELQ